MELVTAEFLAFHDFIAFVQISQGCYLNLSLARSLLASILSKLNFGRIVATMVTLKDFFELFKNR